VMRRVMRAQLPCGRRARERGGGGVGAGWGWGPVVE
jgi:hypothetical protein